MSGPADEGAGLSRARAWALALTATSTMAVSYVDRQALAAIAPSVQAALGIRDEQYGWLLSAFALAYLVGAPVAGRLVDRVGARRGLLGAVLVWSVVAAAHALVPGFAALFALRVLLGLAESPSFPGAAQTVHRALPPKDRARGLGILFTGSSFGAMIAPPLATWLAARFGFRFAFIGTAIVGLSWIPLWLSLTSSGAARAALDRRPDAPAKGTSASVPGPFALVVHPAVLRAILLVIASAPLLNLYFSWGTKFLVHDHGMTQLATGRIVWIPPVFFDLGSIAFGHFASSRGRGGGVPRYLIAIGGLLGLAGALVPFAPTPMTAILLIGVSAAGAAGFYGLGTADMLARVPPGVVSAAGGICAAAQSVAQIVINPLIGRTIESTGSYTLILVALGLWMIPGCVGWLLWQPPPVWRERGEDVSPA